MNIPLLTTTKLVVMRKSSLSATDTGQPLPTGLLGRARKEAGGELPREAGATAGPGGGRTFKHPPPEVPGTRTQLPYLLQQSAKTTPPAVGSGTSATR